MEQQNNKPKFRLEDIMNLPQGLSFIKIIGEISNQNKNKLASINNSNSSCNPDCSCNYDCGCNDHCKCVNDFEKTCWPYGCPYFDYNP